MRVQSLGLKDSLEKEMATRPVFLPGESYRGAWQAVVHGVTRSWTGLKQLSMHAWTQFSTLIFFFFKKRV